MIYVIQINVKYVFQETFQAHKLLRIDLTDDLQLPSNHNKSFTRIMLQGQIIDDI